MMMHEIYAADLQTLAGRGRLRALRGQSGIDFTSNDYLGLAESDELRQAAIVRWRTAGGRGRMSVVRAACCSMAA